MPRHNYKAGVHGSLNKPNKMNSRMRLRKDEIFLEDYLHFFHSNKQVDVTANFLNQIISIHGFKKLRFPKKVLIEAIEKLDLVNLSRSTLVDNGVSSCAFINLEDVIADLNNLNWQDCCITSIQTLSSCSYKDNFCPDLNGSNPKSTAEDYSLNGVAFAAGCSSYSGSATVRIAVKRPSKRKRGCSSIDTGDVVYSSSGPTSFESS